MKLLLPVALLACASVRAALIDHDALFRRADPIPAVGSPEWSALYPAPGSTPANVPQLWLDALARATAAGLIPNLPPATMNAGFPSYPNGISAQDRDRVCHNTYGCSRPSDVLQGPDGRIGISQDDGPLPPGVRLYQFLKQENISTTHFYIGGNIKNNWNIFTQALALPNQHFAVHTWSHPYMSSLSNKDIVSEIGWTMQILADSNGGRIPAFWRPPYGDVDDRVRAIAKEVMGITTVIWGPDSEDWAIGVSTTEDKVKADLRSWYAGPKSPGLVILQHEVNDAAVDAFIECYPLIKSNGWQGSNIADMLNLPYYKNAASQNDVVRSGAIAGSGPPGSSIAAGSSAASSVVASASSAMSAMSAAASSARSGSAIASSAVASAASSAISRASSAFRPASSAAASASVSTVNAASSGLKTLSLSGLVGFFAFLVAAI